MKTKSTGNRCLTINESMTMKKIYSFMVAAVALFAAVSCNKEMEQENLPAAETVVYTAFADGSEPESKAELNQTTLKSEWVAGDAITVLDGTKPWKFETNDEGAHADFANSEGFGDFRPVIAVYPAGQWTADIANKTVNAYIPTYQEARQNTYNENAVLSVAYSENNSFAFKNACALLKFTVKGEKSIKAIEFCGNNEEAITGNVLVSLNDDNTVESVEGLDTDFVDGDKSWTGKGTWVKLYSVESDWCYKEGIYYAAIAPANFTKGFSLNLILADDSKVEAFKKRDEAYDLKANTILNLGEIEYVAPEAPVAHPWAVAGTFNDWSTSANPMVLEGDYYVAKGITGLNYTAPTGEDTGSATGFKFVENGTSWKGGEGQVTAGTWAWTWNENGTNIYVADATAEAAYDIYLTASAEPDGGRKFVVVPAESPMPEDKPAETPEVVVDYWAVVGTMNGWAADYEKFTLLEGDWHVATDVKLYASDQFKLRADGNWDFNRGAAGDTDGVLIENDVETDVFNNGKNFSVSESGIYSIYINKSATKVKVVKTADLPAESIPGQPCDWAVAGTFNDWSDNPMVTTATPEVYVVKNVELGAYAEFKIKKQASGTDNGWGTSYGVKSINYLDSNVWVSVQSGSGTNIFVVKSGSYDIYFDFANVRVYVMTAGTDFKSATEQTTDGKAPVISNARTIYLKAGAWDTANAWFLTYTWGGASSAAMVKMVPSDKGSGIYECEVPNDRTNIIFLRKNPSNTSLDWNGEWNRFEITLPSDKNCFTVTKDWGNGGWSNI